MRYHKSCIDAARKRLGDGNDQAATQYPCRVPKQHLGYCAISLIQRMPNKIPKLRIEHLYKIFGDTPEVVFERLKAGASKEEIQSKTGHVVAVSDVSFDIQAGEMFVVMGLSGSGKSTLVRCINQLITPTAGRVLVDDEDIVAASPERLREIRVTKIAMVFQHFALFPHRTVAENAAYGLKVRGVDPATRRAAALEALDMVGLKNWADLPPDNLSGGMQQRVGLARALAVKPDIMLMDEPFSALDPLIRRDMQAELLELQKQLKTTIVFITHDLHEALTLGHHIAIMKDGQVVQIGTPEDIVARPADSYVSAFTQDVDRSRVITLGAVMQPAITLTLEQDTVKSARAQLEATGSSALYVVDGDGKPVGLVTDRMLDGAEKVNGEDLAGLMRADFPKAFEHTILGDAFLLLAQGLPVATLDAAGRLRGVVDPLAVYPELAGSAAPNKSAARSF